MEKEPLVTSPAAYPTKPAILSNAAALLCCHNHPSGAPQPSIAHSPFPWPWCCRRSLRWALCCGRLSQVPCAGSMRSCLRDLGRQESAGAVAWSPTPPATEVGSGHYSYTMTRPRGKRQRPCLWPRTTGHRRLENAWAAYGMRPSSANE